MKRFFNKHNGLAVIIATALALGVTGCGGRSTTQSAIGPISTTPTVPNYNPYPPAGSGGGTAGSITPGTDTTWADALQLNFTLNGTNSGNEVYTSQPITTDNLLQVRVTALPAGANSVPNQNTNFSANYFCAGFTISAMGMDVDTKALAVNGGVPGLCQDGATQVIDFSQRLSSGHGDVVISVSKPKYDWYCQMYFANPFLMGGTATMYCPLHTVYQYHTILGKIEVRTNGSGVL